jgi:hypothetical protein
MPDERELTPEEFQALTPEERQERLDRVDRGFEAVLLGAALKRVRESWRRLRG